MDANCLRGGQARIASNSETEPYNDSHRVHILVLDVNNPSHISFHSAPSLAYGYSCPFILSGGTVFPFHSP